jgi:hypothetical protein
MVLRKLRGPAHQDIEGIELDFVIVFAAVQAVEVGYAVDAEQHRFAIDHKQGISVSERRFRDERLAIAPVEAVSGEQAHTLALPLDD